MSSLQKQAARSYLSHLRIKQVERDHVLGWEDIMKQRKYSLSLRCTTLEGGLIKVSAKDFRSIFKMDADPIQKQKITDFINKRDLLNLQKI